LPIPRRVLQGKARDLTRRAAHDGIVRGPDQGAIAGAADAAEKAEAIAAARHAATQQRADEDSVMLLLARALDATQTSSFP